MPCYDFLCEKCEHEYEDVITLAENEEKKFPKCPKCKSKKVHIIPGCAGVHFIADGFTKRSF